MKMIDRLLQRWRIRKASRYIPSGSRVLDVGCADGVLFRQLGSLIGSGVGIDPTLTTTYSGSNYRLLPGVFPKGLENEAPFDVITLLAVLEHIPRSEQSRFAGACARTLKPGGSLIVTVPSALVDPILNGLRCLRLIDGMSLEEHFGFDAKETPAVFRAAQFELLTMKKFQLGLNNLFVFRKTQQPGQGRGSEN